MVSAAAVPAISERQTFRLLAKYQEQGSNGLTSEDLGSMLIVMLIKSVRCCCDSSEACPAELSALASTDGR